MSGSVLYDSARDDVKRCAILVKNDHLWKLNFLIENIVNRSMFMSLPLVHT